MIQYDGRDYKWGFQIKASAPRHQWFKLYIDPSQSRFTELSKKYHDPLAEPPAYGSPDDRLQRAKDMTTDFLTGLRKHTENVLRRTLQESAVASTAIEYIVRRPDLSFPIREK